VEKGAEPGGREVVAVGGVEPERNGFAVRLRAELDAVFYGWALIPCSGLRRELEPTPRARLH
jgi:hypothetical protein